MYALEHLAESTRTINSKKALNNEDGAVEEELSGYMTGSELAALAKETESDTVAASVPTRTTVKRQALLSKHRQNSRDGYSDTQQQQQQSGNRPGYRVRVAEASDVKAAFIPS